MDELWKDIGESKYQVSTLGNVRNTRSGLVLKPRASRKKGDYACYDVNISDGKGGGQRNHKVHRLVALAFLPNPNNYTEIDHIDRNPANNQVSNLRWATRSEQCFNSRTRCDNALGERNIQKRLNMYQVKRVGVPYKAFYTLQEAIDYRDSFIPSSHNG
jgi:hypothetical protein